MRRSAISFAGNALLPPVHRAIKELMDMKGRGSIKSSGRSSEIEGLCVSCHSSL